LLEEEEGTAEWCLVTVGWDGEFLPVAAFPLLDGHGGRPAASARVIPVFDAPLPPGRAARDVQALHLEPQKGRLWAVLASGDLLAWDLLQARSLGRWRPQWPLGTSAAFRPTAVCEDPGRGMLFAIGRGPRLARAEAPLHLLEAPGVMELTDVSEAFLEPVTRTIGAPAALTDGPADYEASLGEDFPRAASGPW